jgi:general nucleoside transport system permease protein
VSEDRATRDPGGGASRPPALRRLLGDSVGALAFPLVAILISFLIGAIIMVATGYDPIAAYGALLRGAFGSPLAVGRTLLNATPLIFTGLAVAVAFRAGLFNIGGEGQFYVGAITAAVAGAYLGSLGVVGMVLALAA